MTRRIRCRRRPIGERTPSALVEGLQISYSLVHRLSDTYPPPGVSHQDSFGARAKVFTQLWHASPQERHGSPAALDNRCSLKRSHVEVRKSRLTRSTSYKNTCDCVKISAQTPPPHLKQGQVFPQHSFTGKSTTPSNNGYTRLGGNIVRKRSTPPIFGRLSASGELWSHKRWASSTPPQWCVEADRWRTLLNLVGVLPLRFFIRSYVRS